MPHLGFLAVAMLVALTPGANNLLGLRHALRHGIPAALVGIGGRLVAFSLLIAAVVAGLGPLLSASRVALEVIRWAGVVYLLYLGVQALRTAGRGAEPEAEIPSGSRLAPARREFLVAVTNPKAVLVFTAFVPQFVEPAHGSVAVQLAELGALYLVTETVAAVLYALGGRLIRAAGPGWRARRALDRGTGVVLIGMAGALAAESAA